MKKLVTVYPENTFRAFVYPPSHIYIKNLSHIVVNHRGITQDFFLPHKKGKFSQLHMYKMRLLKLHHSYAQAQIAADLPL